MTELYIDRQMVVLPETFSITIVEENPFFTKNGKYTYDISLSLLDPINARIYKHLNRINRSGGIPKQRSAYMVVDNEVVLNGTEVILEHTDKDVKIQLVSGNSELNFLIGGDEKLRDLNLGKAEEYSGTINEINHKIRQDLEHPYPERDWMLLPFYTQDNDMIGNRFEVVMVWNDDGGRAELSYYYNGAISIVGDHPANEHGVKYKNYRPQPYFCFIINKVLESLGYEVLYNALANHPIFKYYYVVHGYDTMEFAKMLPDWTVSDFISKIETQFNCLILVDEFSKTAKLLLKNDPQSHKKIEILIDDEYTEEYDNDNEKTVQKANIAYSFDDVEYYKFQKLNKDVIAYAKSDYYTDANSLVDKVVDATDKDRFKKMFSHAHVGFTSMDFIAFKGDDDEVIPKKVNSFRPLYNNPDKEDIDIEFDILPAPMKTDIAQVNRLIPVIHGQEFFYYRQMPIALNSEPFVIEDPDDEYTLQGLIEGSESVQENQDALAPKMYLAIYDGTKKLNFRNNTSPVVRPRYPFSYVESLAEYFRNKSTVDYMHSSMKNPFRLEFLNAELYKKSDIINTDRTYKFLFYTYEKIDVSSIFVANNKEFRCLKIERTVTHKGFKTGIKGEFYPS